MNWISVEKETPKEHKTVLISWFPKYMKGKGESLPAIYEDGIFIQAVTGDLFLNIEQKEITHWMPLPEPPKQ